METEEAAMPTWPIGQMLIVRALVGAPGSASGTTKRMRVKVLGIVGSEVFVQCDDVAYHDEKKPHRCLNRNALASCIAREGKGA